MQSHEIYCSYGMDGYAQTMKLLCAARPPITPDLRIGIKPNLVNARPAADGSTTHPEIVRAIIDYCKQQGAHNLCILESAWVGDSAKRAFEVCGYAGLSRETGVPLYDLREDTYTTATVQGIPIEFSDRAHALDYLINVPVIKGHCQTDITCALKNMKGCISDASKRAFHRMGLHKPIAALAALRTAELVIADGLCGDLNFEEGGTPVEMGLVALAQDSLLLDCYAAQLLGYHPDEIGYLNIAGTMGVGRMQGAQIVALDAPHPLPRAAKDLRNLRGRIIEQSACSACYAACVRALSRSGYRGVLHVGQGFQGVVQEGLGVGRCTAGFSQNIPGCPPTAAQILQHLER